jgi:hypothetical protein
MSGFLFMYLAPSTRGINIWLLPIAIGMQVYPE